MAMAWQRVDSVRKMRSVFPQGSPQYQLAPELQPRETEVFDKITMSAFEGTPHDNEFRDCKVEAFAIVGVATEVGIEPTVRQAADLGYIPVLPALGRSGASPSSGTRCSRTSTRCAPCWTGWRIATGAEAPSYIATRTQSLVEHLHAGRAAAGERVGDG